MHRAILGLSFCLVASLLVAEPAAAPAKLPSTSQRYDCNPADGSFKTVDKRVYRRLPSGSAGVYADIKNTSRVHFPGRSPSPPEPVTDRARNARAPR